MDTSYSASKKGHSRDPFLSNLTSSISPSHRSASLPTIQDPLHPTKATLRMNYHPKERVPCAFSTGALSGKWSKLGAFQPTPSHQITSSQLFEHGMSHLIPKLTEVLGDGH